MSYGIVFRNEDGQVLEKEPDATRTATTDPVLFWGPRGGQPDGIGSVSSQSVVHFDEPNELTKQVFLETDAGTDIVKFDSIKELLNDLET